MESIVTCRNCGQKNRIRESEQIGTFHCGRCKEDLSLEIFFLPFSVNRPTYRNVPLRSDEREVIDEFLGMSVIENPDARQLIEHLFVADALCMYGNLIVKDAMESNDRELAQHGCETVERAMHVASDECFYAYRLAQVLEVARFENCTHYYRVFLNRAKMDPGTLAFSPLDKESFIEALAVAKSKVGEGTSDQQENHVCS